MVKFSVFNELSLPFSSNLNIAEKFDDFFKLLEAIKARGLKTLRLSSDFKNYEISPGVYFKQFVGEQEREFGRKIVNVLINNGVVLIDSPIIQEEERKEQDTIKGYEYFYNGQATDGGLACCDIWGTIAVSFNSDDQWDTDWIALRRDEFSGDADIVTENVNIRHSSQTEHLEAHQEFFDALQKEIQLGVTRENLWKRKQELFPDIVIFCPEVEVQIHKLNKQVFDQAISILRAVETQRKLITSFNHSGEGKTVRTSPKFRQMREFTIDGEKVFFEKHIKSLPHGCRMYFIERDNKVHIGYIGKHPKGPRD